LAPEVTIDDLAVEVGGALARPGRRGRHAQSSHHPTPSTAVSTTIIHRRTFATS
jgi:hypothetical protein